ncbi:electron transport complex subunit RsxC [Halioxenophilus sp. WMMB6]|uniref:electron transport complex subunit RsxC n=1 Tax=Halioxenophilus sp. WMMB6 TaxID=3073815 RepID=UPI00295E9375|nr:electron transport complex subunit RsxC [Halioxenophilus sp. WMMB6]
MWFSAFRGGVHPDGFKELSSQLPIKTLPLPKELRVSLRQHAGSEAIPVVKAGERVLKGQLIGRPGEGLSAAVHAPTSGIVTAVEEVLAAHPSGIHSKAVVIEVDGKDEAIPTVATLDPFTMDRAELAQRVSEAGIVGMGGAAFPAAVKLSAATRSKDGIETLMINGGECEPYLTADDRLMRERADQIILGARLIQYIINAGRIAIAIEDNKGEAIEAMRAAAKPYSDIEVVVVPTRYPMGSAKQMIQAVTGKEVPAGGRSSDVGVLMHNVATAYAIAQCLTRGEPLISRIVTISGGAVKRPQNVEALIGTPISHLVEQCGGTSDTPDRIILGGPMMGVIMPSTDVPLNKGSAGVLALNKREVAAPAASPCIRCARCVDACPMGLVPLEMANHARAQDFDGANDYGLKDCILCGSCAYVCPSHIPLVHYFQYAKGEQSAQKATAKRSDYTRELSDAKRERKEKEAAAKAAAKAAKRKPKPAKKAVAEEEDE